MRRSAAFIALTSVLLITGSALAAPLAAETPPDFAITNASLSPAEPHAGEAVVFSIAYLNQGAEALQADAAITVTLTVMTMGTTDRDPVMIGQACAAVLPLAAGLRAGDANTHEFTDCPFTFPKEGTYQLIAETTLTDPTGAPVPDPAEGNRFVKTGVTVKAYETALPDQFSRLFAGLGMFAAVMAIMSLGTEAVIDSVKVALGMKSKVNALDALKDMERLLPGQLASLGVGATEQEKIKRLTRDLRDTLKPVNDWLAVEQAIVHGQFGEAYTGMMVLLKTPRPDPAEQLAALKEAGRKALDKLDHVAGLPPDAREAFKAQLDQRLNGLQLSDLSDFPNKVFAELQNIAKQLPDQWLAAKTQHDALLTQGYRVVNDAFDTQVKPILEAVGFDPAQVNEMTGQFKATLASVDTQAMAATDTYLVSLQKLLEGVEGRRNDTQSPARKVWRMLRDAAWADLAACVLIGLATMFLIWLNNPKGDTLLVTFPFHAEAFPTWGYLLIWGGIASVMAGLALALLSALGKGRYEMYLAAYIEDTQGNATMTKEHALATDLAARHIALKGIDKLTRLHKAELLWNLMRGSQSAWPMDPMEFGEPAPMPTEKLEATNVAQTLLQMSDHQRDQEDTRLRWLRLVSVMVGFVLAYLLQIDAAVLLEAALPGISHSINLFALDGEQLHRLWYALPSQLNLTPGIFLTGLAASAGSTFWHDQLDRLQSVKKQAEGVAQALKQARELTSRD